MSVNKADIEKLIQLVNEGDIESLTAEKFEQFQYQGFDPLKIVEALLKVKTNKTISDEDFKEDIYTMVAVGMIKGSVNENNINKMSDGGKVALRGIIGKYSVKMGGGRSQPSSVITFPRVMATFPDIAIRLSKVIGAKEFRGGPFESSALPYYLQVQVFPAIIPRRLEQNAKTMLLTASLCYSIDQTIQISGFEKPDLKQLSATQSNFINLGHSSPVPSAVVREKVFKTLEVANDYDKICSVLELYKKHVDSTFTIMTKTQFTLSIGTLETSAS